MKTNYYLTSYLNSLWVMIKHHQWISVFNNDKIVTYYKLKILEISNYYPYGWIKFRMDYSFKT